MAETTYTPEELERGNQRWRRMRRLAIQDGSRDIVFLWTESSSLPRAIYKGIFEDDGAVRDDRSFAVVEKTEEDRGRDDDTRDWKVIPIARGLDADGRPCGPWYDLGSSCPPDCP